MRTCEKRLCYRPFTPQLVRGSLFEFPRGRDVLLSYPYESMQPFLRLVRRAANDPGVTSIQITIYRLAKEAKLIDYLCARGGKRQGSDWCSSSCAPALTSRTTSTGPSGWKTAGCRVIYGFEGFKVHSKVCLITRLEHGNAPLHHPDRHRQLQRKDRRPVHRPFPHHRRPEHRRATPRSSSSNMAIGNLEEDVQAR